MPDTVSILAATAGAAFVGLLLRWILPVSRPLRARIDPYLRPAAGRTEAARSSSVFVHVFGPPFRHVARALGRVLERSGDEVGVLRIRQAGWYEDLPDSEVWTAYRVAQLRSLVTAAVVSLTVGYVFDLEPFARWSLVGLALLVAMLRHRGALNKAVDQRREQMRGEIYTINQLLAMRVRSGAGVVNAVHATVVRGRGQVVGELSLALRLHRAGWRAADAFRRIAETTPEPFCGRTYRLLATADERGAELATALLDLAEDVREARREMIKRSATKRRAAMLVPTIAVLAPVLILFVAAPLPFVITGWR